MATDQWGQGIDTLDYTDKPDLVTLGETLRDSLTPRSVMRFANATARDAAITTPAAGMPCWLADVKALQVYDGAVWTAPAPAVATSTTGLTAATGFSAVSFSGRNSGHLYTVNATWSRTGTDIAADSAGNITDTALGVLPSGFRPPETMYALVGDGFGCGECQIGTDGTVTLRAWSANGAIVAGRNLRITSTWVGA